MAAISTHRRKQDEDDRFQKLPNQNDQVLSQMQHLTPLVLGGRRSADSQDTAEDSQKQQNIHQPSNNEFPFDRDLPKKAICCFCGWDNHTDQDYRRRRMVTDAIKDQVRNEIMGQLRRPDQRGQQHRRACYYGDNCTRFNCKFSHPKDRDSGGERQSQGNHQEEGKRNNKNKIFHIL